MSSGGKTHALLKKAAVDGDPRLDALVERLGVKACHLAESRTVFEEIEARRALVDAAYHLVWNAQQIVKRGRAPSRSRGEGTR